MRLFLIIALCITAFQLKAQPSMLGKTGAYIKANCKIATYVESSWQNDTTQYLVYIPKDDHTTTFRYYLNKEGVCNIFIIQQQVKDMVAIIGALNDSFIKIGDDEWISKAKDMSIILSYEKGSKYFATLFTLIN